MTDKPAYIPPQYKGKAHSDTFTTRPFADDFETRRQAFFAQVQRYDTHPEGSRGVFFDLARLAAGAQPNEAAFAKVLTDRIDARLDCADFVMQGVIRLLYQFGGQTEGRRPASGENHLQSPVPGLPSAPAFSPKLLQQAKETTLNFKYWPDEPGTDSMCTWTENHQILFATAAYLAGQLYPDQVFTNSGRTGREMMAIHRPRIDRWLRMRFKSGFSEWLSNVYYVEDWPPLLNLVDFAANKDLKERARMILDLTLFDFALNSFRGVFGSTHGRSYEQHKKWAALESTTGVSKLLFGTGAFSNCDNMSVVSFALSEKYRMPQVIYNIAHDPSIRENRQRMGFRVEDATEWGLTYDDLESGMVFLSNEAYLHPKTAALTIKMFTAFNWWENEFFKDFKPFKGFLKTMQKLGGLPVLGKILEKDVCRNIRDEANIYTYRTPDYMLSTAQDHRAGFGGDQHHIWQATLGPDAVCFTTHPVKNDTGTPNYWTGSGTLPRVAQVKNVAIAIYNISTMPGLYLTNNLFFTHAWLAKDQFDEVIEQEGWIFARKGDGYLALRSQNPHFWNENWTQMNADERRYRNQRKSAQNCVQNNSEDFNREIIVEGKKNIWIQQFPE